MTQMPQPHPNMPQPVPAHPGAPTPPRPVAMPQSVTPQPVPMPTPVAPQPMPMPAQMPRQSLQPQMPPGSQTMPYPAARPAPVQDSSLLDYSGQPQLGQMPPNQMAPGQMGMSHNPMGHVEAARPYAPLDDTAREGGEKPLPSISVHAFCDRQETAHCVNETTRDWRMKRANVKIYMGGLPAAIEFYHKENTPSLILIESGMRGEELFNQLEQLASVCDEGTKVVVIGATNDIRLYRQLMDKGVSDYLVPPLHPLHVIRSLGELYSDPEQPFIGRVAAFFGAKGGVGSSALAHNTAWVLSEIMGQETSLIDLDASWGTTGLDFAYDNTSGLEEALGEPDRLDETLMDRIMIRHTQKLSILPTSSSLNTKPVMATESYEAVVNAVRGISPLAVLDMPHYWSDWTTNVLTSVDDVVVVATPDLAGMRNAKNLIDFLKTQRPNDAEPILILNKVGMSKTTEISVKDFGAMVGMDPNIVIGWDPESHFEGTNEGKMLTEVKSADQTVQGLKYLANRIRTGTYDVRLKGDVAPTKKGLLKIGGGKKEKGEAKSMFSFLKKGS
ncbi:AAA family ATPase [Litorimonas sp. WD9-15]|uniref:AAA family ATPase n=1 Tax=Litorimonas sp. WD9-15 TaxID=3418716 RepID=UPI003CFEF158